MEWIRGKSKTKGQSSSASGQTRDPAIASAAMNWIRGKTKTKGQSPGASGQTRDPTLASATMNWIRGKSKTKGQITGGSKEEANSSPSLVNLSPGALQVELDLRRVKKEQYLEYVTKYSFTFAQMVAATSNFSRSLGGGAFGKVYQGMIEDEEVAIKKLKKGSFQGIEEFTSELIVLSKASHPHVVRLIGFCAEGKERLIVYEYMANGTLSEHLHKTKSGKGPLDWASRMRIASEIAQGLSYMHKRKVMHCDLNTSNILLDVGNRAKIADFGLAKQRADHGSDIFSFGMILLELITGRKAIRHSKLFGKALKSEDRYLSVWAAAHLPVSSLEELQGIADPLLKENYNNRELFEMLEIAQECIQKDPKQRPDAASVAMSFEGLVPQPRGSFHFGDRKVVKSEQLKDDVDHVQSQLKGKGKVKEEEGDKSVQPDVKKEEELKKEEDDKIVQPDVKGKGKLEDTEEQELKYVPSELQDKLKLG